LINGDRIELFSSREVAFGGNTFDCPPSGIEKVFINGRQVVAAGKADGAQLPGMVL
jgi:hypothetical protein